MLGRQRTPLDDDSLKKMLEELAIVKALVAHAGAVPVVATSKLTIPVLSNSSDIVASASDLHDEIKELSYVSPLRHGLFRDGIASELSSQLLLNTAYGNQARVEALLSISPARRLKHLFTRGDVEDYSGRKFTHISAFQYAVWAGDSHMWKMMLNCLQKACEAGYSKWDVIRQKLLGQFEEVEASGVRYVLNGKEVRESHFDFGPLIHALKGYSKHIDDWSENELKKYWCARVGLAQRLVPAHVAQEYGRSDRSFSPRPLFQDTVLPRGLTFYNSLKMTQEAWWPADSSDNRLGVDFAIYRGGAWSEAYGIHVYLAEKARVPHCSIDLVALTALRKVRLGDDMRDLRKMLNPPILELDESGCTRVP